MNVATTPSQEMLDAIYNIIKIIGIVSVIAGLIYIGAKLQILNDLKKTSEKIKSNLKVVCDFLIRNNSNFNVSELQGYSPLSLTAEGMDFIAKVGFENIFNTNKEDFFKCIENEKPKLKYDVETASIKSLFILSDKEYMSFLKILFYNDPKRNMENTAPTLGVYVRDKYLADHPEITE